MSTTKKTKVIVISITIAIALFLFLQIQFNFAGNVLHLPFALGFQGSSTLSLSQANLQSSSPYFSGKAWILTFAQGVLAQRYTGTFSPSDVQAATSDSSTTTNSFSVDVQYDAQKCDYNIYRTSLETPIYDLQKKTWFCLLSTGLADAQKTSGFSNVLYYGKYSVSTTCFAIGYSTQSPVGNLASPNKESQYTISVTTPSGTQSKTINTLSGSGQGSIGSNVYVAWMGNLESGISCPDKDPFVPVYVNGIWIMGNADSYNNYKSLLSGLATTSQSSQDVLWNQITNAIAQAKQSQSFGTLESSTSLTNAVVKVTVADALQFPVTTLYIKASEIGIYTPAPQISLSSPSSDCFKTGETGSISIGLQNTGDEYGTWNVYAQCQNPFTSTQSIMVGLQAGQSTTRLIPLSAAASQKTTGSCTIFAESPAGTQQVNVGTCVDPQITCTKNEKFCGVSGTNEVIKQCSSDGATSSIIETCQTGYVCDKSSGAIECISADTVSGPGFFDGVINFFKNLLGGIFDFFTIIRIIFALVVVIFVTLFSKDLIMNFKALRGKEAIAWIVAIVVGGLLGYLAFTIFWVGIIALVIFIVLKFIPFKKLMKR